MKIISRGERFPLITMATILSAMMFFQDIKVLWTIIFYFGTKLWHYYKFKK